MSRFGGLGLCCEGLVFGATYPLFTLRPSQKFLLFLFYVAIDVALELFMCTAFLTKQSFIYIKTARVPSTEDITDSCAYHLD